MVFPASSLISDCCQGLIIMDGPDYQCIKCMKHCKSGGTLADLAAPQKERQRLEREVIEAAKAYGRANQALEDHMRKSTHADSDPADGWQQLRDMESTWEEMLLEAIKPLLEFESQQIKK